MGRIAAADMAHKEWVCQLLWDSLTPFYSNAPNSVSKQKCEEETSWAVLGEITGNDADPGDDGTETSFSLLSWWPTGIWAYPPVNGVVRKSERYTVLGGCYPQ